MKKTITLLSMSAMCFITFGQWSDQNSGITNDLNNVFFTNNNDGWALGRQGKLIHTSNGGSSWAEQNSGTSEDLHGIFMVNNNVGYAVGNKGKISKYNGSTWTAVNTSETRDVFGVYFINENTGWAVGDWGRLYRTTNGGGSWVNQNNDAMASYKYNAVHMFNENDGFAVGTSGRIARYNGSSWAGQTSGITTELLGAHFLNSNFGFAVGKSSTILFFNGSSWSTHNAGLPDNSFHIYDVHIISSTEAYAVATPGFGGEGVILKFNGSVWSIDYEYTGMWSELFYGVHFSPQGKGFAVGAGGMVKTKNTNTGGGTGTASISDLNENLPKVAVFPNPFVNELNFNIDSKENNPIAIQIVDSSGKLVYKNTHEVSNEATITIYEANSFPDGIYLVTITSNNYTTTQKLIKH
jgi:photosystem II stability/assembly factor-like uncharacterized protein